MPGPLANQRHEIFAQALARGETDIAAYATAGYVPTKQGANRLAKNPAVQARVRELQQRAARRTEISIATLTEDFLRLAEKGEALGEAPGLQVARASLMDAAKLNGLVVNTTERVIRTPQERRERIAELERVLEGKPAVH